MSPDDHRHGTTAGYSKHRRDNEDACPPCRIAQNDYNRREEKVDDIALTCGRWVPNRRGTLDWRPDHELTAEQEAELDRLRIVFAQVDITPPMPDMTTLVLPAATLAEAAADIVKAVA